MPSAPPATVSSNEPAAPRVVPAALYLGLGLTTCSMLLVQQFLTRIYSILFNSGLAFLALSITFLGLGSADHHEAIRPRPLGRLIPKLGDLDPVSEDLLTTQLGELELFAWFIRSHLGS